MNIGQLKKLIADLPDNAKLLVPGSDHSYNVADARVTTALYSEDEHCWTEDYGEETTPEADYGKRLPVVVFS